MTKEEPNMGVYDTHKFLFTLKYENRLDDLKVEFIDRENQTQTIELKDIIITASPVSCKLIDSNDVKHIVPFIRILKVFRAGELAWDNSEADRSHVKVIKGWD